MTIDDKNLAHMAASKKLDEMVRWNSGTLTSNGICRWQGCITNVNPQPDDIACQVLIIYDPRMDSQSPTFQVNIVGGVGSTLPPESNKYYIEGYPFSEGVWTLTQNGERAYASYNQVMDSVGDVERYIKMRVLQVQQENPLLDSEREALKQLLMNQLGLPQPTVEESDTN